MIYTPHSKNVWIAIQTQAGKYLHGLGFTSEFYQTWNLHISLNKSGQSKIFSKLNLTRTDKSFWFRPRNKIVLNFNLRPRCLLILNSGLSRMFSWHLEACWVHALIFFSALQGSATEKKLLAHNPGPVSAIRVDGVPMTCSLPSPVALKGHSD